MDLNCATRDQGEAHLPQSGRRQTGGSMIAKAGTSKSCVLLLAFALASWAGAARAQAPAAYPKQPVHIIVGVGAGGLIDIYARLLAAPLQQMLGQPVIVENRMGSGGLIGARFVAEAKPDGYTLFAASPGTLPAALLHNPAPYSIASFAPVGLLLEGGSLLGVRAGIPVTTFQELVAYGKANPGKLRYGTSGIGSPTHLSIQYLADLVGVQMTHVPYRGNVPAMQALLQNEVDLAIVDAQGFEKQIRDGEIRPLAQTSRIRAANFPDIPTLPDLVPGFDAPFWLGLFAPAGTPPEVVSELNNAMNAVLASGALTERAAKTGLVARPMNPDAFAKYVREDTERWASVIKAHDIRVE
jgi:tripartite-type tricarboxylate transporter receptor subunit TctC